MWSIKYEYRHKDCKYLPMAEKLKIILSSYTLNHYKIKDALYVTAIHIMEGEKKNVEKYKSYLKKIADKIEIISPNTVFTLTKMEENLSYYEALYNQFLFYPAPILHKDNKEYGEIMSWERKQLIKLMNVIRKSPHTEYFKLLSLKPKKLKNIFLMKITQKITEKQRTIFEYALREGYYNYPRKINLETIAKNFRITKSTCHEILRRAETNLFRDIV
jgi:predicted DNA binding protein